ncbi:hypothetical protein ACLOJK_000024 [Asimina triloba]
MDHAPKVDLPTPVIMSVSQAEIIATRMNLVKNAVLFGSSSNSHRKTGSKVTRSQKKSFISGSKVTRSTGLSAPTTDQRDFCNCRVCGTVGSPLLQVLVGLEPHAPSPKRDPSGFPQWSASGNRTRTQVSKSTVHVHVKRAYHSLIEEVVKEEEEQGEEEEPLTCSERMRRAHWKALNRPKGNKLERGFLWFILASAPQLQFK